HYRTCLSCLSLHDALPILNASNLFLSLILHLGNLFLIVQLHFSKLFLILKSGVNHTSRGSISTSTLPSIKLRKCSSKIITSILSFISGFNRTLDEIGRAVQ